MLWDHADPFNTAVFHGGGGVKTFGNGFGDDRLLVCFKLFNNLLLLFYIPVNLPALVIKIIGNAGLKIK